MNPQLILSAAKAAYENREVAAKLLTKIKDWKQSGPDDSGNEEVALPVDARMERLERGLARNVRLCEEQSELIAGLAQNVAELSITTQALLKRTRWMVWCLVILTMVSAIALYLAFRPL